jgi:hypothetical protein
MEMDKLSAYRGNQSEKEAILAQLQAHADADEIVKGIGWQHGKGCAVGCTIHTYPAHYLYVERFGIPEILAALEDAIFEGLSNSNAQKWPIRFMSAIEPNADLSLVGWKFLHWILTDKKINPGINHKLVKKSVSNCASIIFDLSNNEAVDEEYIELSHKDASKAARNASDLSVWMARNAAEAALNSIRSIKYPLSSQVVVLYVDHSKNDCELMSNKLIELLKDAK